MSQQLIVAETTLKTVTEKYTSSNTYGPPLSPL